MWIYSEAILTENVDALLEGLAHVVQYQFDHWDRDAFQSQLFGGNAKEGDWFDYVFEGESHSVEFSIQYESGSSVFDAKIRGPEEIRERISLLLHLVANYKMESFGRTALSD